MIKPWQKNSWKKLKINVFFMFILYAKNKISNGYELFNIKIAQKKTIKKFLISNNSKKEQTLEFERIF